ncbi:hypothetical protein [Streptomyces sp. NPDC096132]|uniref:hypothetical protein n=1 Tax=Streptomyces sp. NPDC096132 TaxID=3366075 RepID=UPI00382C92DA
MVSPPAQMQAWYFFSDDLPDGQLIVPFKTRHGLAFGVRTGAMPEATLEALNETARFVLGVGLAHLGPTEKPPDTEARKE